MPGSDEHLKLKIVLHNVGGVTGNQSEVQQKKGVTSLTLGTSGVVSQRRNAISLFRICRQPIVHRQILHLPTSISTAAAPQNQTLRHLLPEPLPLPPPQRERERLTKKKIKQYKLTKK